MNLILKNEKMKLFFYIGLLVINVFFVEIAIAQSNTIFDNNNTQTEWLLKTAAPSTIRPSNPHCEYPTGCNIGSQFLSFGDTMCIFGGLYQCTLDKESCGFIMVEIGKCQ